MGRGRLSNPEPCDKRVVTTFADLKLSEKSLHALDRAGFEQPTPIQAQAIPPALAGKDVIGTAATGTGKTAAFLLPIIERLAGKTGTRALVLAPTRELALQIGEELERFGKGDARPRRGGHRRRGHVAPDPGLQAIGAR